MPRVSVIIASFNHERYVGECIQSVLDQTYQDFEIIITDDGSSDRTVEVIKEFADPRIQLHTHGRNQGACIAANNCIRKASGEYIAVLNSDDAWEPVKLREQVDYLDNHSDVGAVFTKVTFINETGRRLSPQEYDYFYVFEQENRSRYAWLNRFFFKGNCLCHPSILIRKKCYDDIGLLDERLASLPDFDMWVRLCLRHEIHILDKKLVRFLVRDNEGNVSSPSLPNFIRIRFEGKQILNHFLTIKDEPTFLKVFPEAKKYGEMESAYIPYFLGRMALEAGSDFSQLWGLEVLYNSMGNPDVARELERKYGFRYRDLFDLTSSYDVFRIAPAPVTDPSLRKISFGIS